MNVNPYHPSWNGIILKEILIAIAILLIFSSLIYGIFLYSIR